MTSVRHARPKAWTKTVVAVDGEPDRLGAVVERHLAGVAERLEVAAVTPAVDPDDRGVVLDSRHGDVDEASPSSILISRLMGYGLQSPIEPSGSSSVERRSKRGLANARRRQQQARIVRAQRRGCDQVLGVLVEEGGVGVAGGERGMRQRLARGTRCW